ncbi:MAG: DUF4160 domain-containing protein [Acidobacteriota bacterium]|nr:DUF4160 domain-containing protein [Acidobacteriota bacterium]
MPPHVHVFSAGCEMIVNLGCFENAVSLRENFSFKSRQVRDILRIVQTHRTELCGAWKEIHGDIR